MMIVDAHAHIFPDKIALKASGGISRFYDMPVKYDGKLATLLDLGRSSNISHYVVQSVATVPGQVTSINNFIAEQMRLYPDILTGLGTLHPAADDLDADLEQLIGLGLKGVKLHPDFQKFYIDSPKAFEIYEKISGKLPLLLHTGDFRYDYSHPRRLAHVLDTFPKLVVIAAHFGGWSEWDAAAEILSGKDVYVDTSSSLYELPPQKASELIHLFGADRVLFGTDYPMWGYEDELERLYKLGLDTHTLNSIMGGNAKRVFGIL